MTGASHAPPTRRQANVVPWIVPRQDRLNRCAGTPFAGVVVAPMLRVPPEARTIDVGGGIRIALLALIPLHPEEIAVKVERGTDALIEVLDRGRITELLDPRRPSYA
ncbi:suppressor of fused domain protein [Micromonospora aurantiaca (nom. illeg.)]